MTRTLPHCATHRGFPLPCVLCSTAGTFPPEAASTRAIAAHRKRSTATRSDFDAAAAERARLHRIDDVDRAIAVFGRKSKGARR